MGAAEEAGGRARRRDAALADALEDGARVLLRLAGRLRALDTDAPTGPPDGASPVTTGRVHGLGERQVRVLALDGLRTELGLSAGEVARELGIAQSNATNLLKRLEALGHLSPIPDERPARWRRSS